MTAVWEIALPDSEKIVLLALADAANDEGHCWPSIATIARKASKSVRTVQIVIQRLIAGGHLTRKEHAGRGCEYWVHPRRDCTPAGTAPPKGVQETPARTAGHPRRGCAQTVRNRKEPKGGRARERASPQVVSDQDQARDDPFASWTAPPIDRLGPKTAALVRQWPPGAWEAVCETFRLHWQAEGGAKGRKRLASKAALEAWAIRDHAKIMRDAKAGVSFVQLAPVLRGGASAGPVEPVAAQAREDDRSQAVRRELRRTLGGVIYDQWFAAVALIGDARGLVVIAPSEFQRAWIEDRFSPKILEAGRAVLGGGLRQVRFQVQDIRERAA